MGADKGALVALEAFGGVPNGQRGGDAPLVVFGGPQGIGAVLVGQENGDRQIIAPLAVAGHHDLLHHIGQILIHLALIPGAGPGAGNIHLHRAVNPGVHGGQIHIDHLFTLFGIGLSGGLLHVANGILHRHDLGKLKEGGL